MHHQRMWAPSLAVIPQTLPLPPAEFDIYWFFPAWQLAGFTLAQSCHCEFCCGMHVTCKNNPFNLTGVGHWKGPQKQWKLSSPQPVLNGMYWKLTLSLSRNLQIATTVQKRSAKTNRLAGSRLSRLPITRTDCKRNVNGSTPWTTGDPNCAGTSLDVSSDILRTLQRALLSGALQACSTPLRQSFKL